MPFYLLNVFIRLSFKHCCLSVPLYTSSSQLIPAQTRLRFPHSFHFKVPKLWKLYAKPFINIQVNHGHRHQSCLVTALPWSDLVRQKIIAGNHVTRGKENGQELCTKFRMKLKSCEAKLPAVPPRHQTYTCITIYKLAL